MSFSPLPSSLFKEKRKTWKNEFIELIKPPNVDAEIGFIHKLDYKTNQLHRNAYVGPARICYYEGGQMFSHQYWVNSKRHRPPEDGPAIVVYREDGRIRYKEYYFEDEFHRLNGAAYICYNENDRIEYEEYWVNGQLHRLLAEGPACIAYNENGQIEYKEYWVNGKEVYSIMMI